MATTSQDRGGGVIESEAVERYDVDGVTYGVHPAARLCPDGPGRTPPTAAAA